ncbi:MAG: hypothetical protein P8Y60_02070 [Calditrichota bacterium]|jgi:hypothetical protein
MIYVLAFILAAFLTILLFIWLRKAQFDAVHRNFLDLEDHYGGRVIRNGFAIRPKYSGIFKEHRMSISISSEKKTADHPRQFYISIYMQVPSPINFTVMSNSWLSKKSESAQKKRYIKKIVHDNYSIEVMDKTIFARINIPKLEDLIENMHPFAYVLVSKRGSILERLSDNLIADTEFNKLDRLLLSMKDLSLVTGGRDSNKN